MAFEDAWLSRVEVKMETEEDSIPINYLGLTSLIINKTATGRPKDLVDLKYLKSLDSDSADL